jgi:hypothetical protein
LRDLGNYFSKLVQIESLEIKEKLKSDGNTKIYYALMECGSKQMRDSMLLSSHTIKGKNIKVCPKLSEEEILEFVENSKKCRIYIKKLPRKISDFELKKLFKGYGKIKKVYSVDGTRRRKKWKYGYVVFQEETAIDNVPLEGVRWKDHLIKWTSFKTKKSKKNTEQVKADCQAWKRNSRASPYNAVGMSRQANPRVCGPEGGFFESSSPEANACRGDLSYYLNSDETAAGMTENQSRMDHYSLKGPNFNYKSRKSGCSDMSQHHQQNGIKKRLLRERPDYREYLDERICEPNYCGIGQRLGREQNFDYRRKKRNLRTISRGNLFRFTIAPTKSSYYADLGRMQDFESGHESGNIRMN